MDARIDQVSAGPAATCNTWLIGDDSEVIVIDPGGDAEAVLTAVGDRDILAVICTHGHASHTAAALEVAERDDSPVALHPEDLLAWREVHSDGDPDIEMADGGIFEVSDVALEVIHTPGHSPGSVSLYCEDLAVVCSGDALAAAGPAPHEKEFPDLPGQLSAIGEDLLPLPGETRVLPGHGEELTIAMAEKQFDSWVATAGDLPQGPA
ncbi:MAG TPA: MBL fold metallo-hydrolase [Streptosporangiaceae bacterium]|jgi:glyoxylase-like metal-dependent hydrolase (beta-lactamase superfamily II)